MIERIKQKLLELFRPKPKIIKVDIKERIKKQPCGCIWEAVDLLPNAGQGYITTEWRYKKMCVMHKKLRSKKITR